MMDLFQLDDHIPNLGIEPSDKNLEELFQLFKIHFLNEEFIFNGCKVIIDVRNSKEEGFEQYPHTFVKLITRGVKGKRCFDKKRANKVHWIRPILENKDSDDVTCFRFLEGDGKIRDYYWFVEGNFIVIMEQISPNYIIVTSFHIDDDRNRRYYQDKYTKRVL